MENFNESSKASIITIATSLEASCFDVEAITESQYLLNFNQSENTIKGREFNECDKN